MSANVMTEIAESFASTTALSWMDSSLCSQTDPDLFFPQNQGDIYSQRQAKAICAACDVREQCYEYALADPDIWGVWGGTTYTERVNIRNADEETAYPLQRVA